MTLTAARQVADAVLYEGYLLYPYRASAAKNQVRWQFGVLGPDGAAAAGAGEEPALAAEVLFAAAPDAVVDVHLRFLQVQARTVERATGDGWEPVDELVVGDVRWFAWSEAVPRELALPGLPLEGAVEVGVRVPGGRDVALLGSAGRLVRTREPLTGTVRLTTRPGGDPSVLRVEVAVRNDTAYDPEPVPGWSARDVAARRSFVGTHLLVEPRGTRVVPLLDPPAGAAADARACVQQRCWPVLVADDEGTDALMISPLVLGDHPTIAPESAGDLFDATEIDEILTLRVLTLTDAERAEARSTDPRAAALLDRCEGLDDAALARLHGARRPASGGAPAPPDLSKGPDLSERPELPALPWWDAAQDARVEPMTDAVTVRGVPVRRGSRVLLRPSRRADAQDLFLAGMTALVQRVYADVDGGSHVAVVLEDDPGADLYDATGRYLYFRPEELEPLPAERDTR